MSNGVYRRPVKKFCSEHSHWKCRCEVRKRDAEFICARARSNVPEPRSNVPFVFLVFYYIDKTHYIVIEKKTEYTMDIVVRYFKEELASQFISVGPISLVLIVFAIASRQRLIDNFWETVFGMICAALGLTLFLFGLKGSIMPLAEKVGELVNQKFSLAVVLSISFIFGVLVTLAEPAVSSLRPLGKAVDRVRAPYLFYMMNDGIEYLLLAIGIGVGIASVVGTARFIYRWRFKPFAIASATLCILVSGLIYFLVEDLRPTISLAWDAGAVTTGPVTVPILLALGKGAVSNSALTQNPRILARRPMQGFGLVTLASLYPVLCVHIYALIVYFTVDKESIQTSEVEEDDGVFDRPPLREIVTGIRSITPLSLVLIGILKLLLRADLPHISMHHLMNENVTQAPAYGNEDAIPDESIAEIDEESVVAEDAAVGRSEESAPGALDEESAEGDKVTPVPPRDSDIELPTDTLVSSGSDIGADAHETPDYHDDEASEAAKVVIRSIFWWALLSSQVGLILFNIGLHYGFTSLGDQVGSLLPAFYSEVEGDPDSPILSKGLGSVVAYLFIFCLAILATRAEPGLKVLSEQVKTLTEGIMKRQETIYSVAVGVAVGMIAGTSRLQLEYSIFPYLAIMYGIAVCLTFFSPAMVVKVAWDSAGVTTGPVTVPFVLSIGLAYAQARVLPAGFGILACASVGPIITVLLVNMGKKKTIDS